MYDVHVDMPIHVYIYIYDMVSFTGGRQDVSKDFMNECGRVVVSCWVTYVAFH